MARDTVTDRGRVRVEQSSKQVRVMLGGVFVAETTRPLLVWEVPYYPTYYFPEEDVRTDLLEATGEVRSSPSRGDATIFTVRVADSEGSAYSYESPEIAALKGHYVFVWGTMDHWFEENEEVFVHARDPYTRVEILPSGRQVRVEVGGVTIAESANASFLYETGLPTRYYLPKTDVRMDLLTASERRTACPYKGNARYWSVTVDGETHDDLVWAYDTPLPESQGIAGLVSFYNERVDIYVDGVLQDRPRTKFA
jgi:uncharacterized protein (DUF427 family)